MMKHQQGFSLTETIITVAIVSTLSLVAYPTFANWQQTFNLRAEVFSLVGQLRMMKMEAIKQNTFVVMQMRDDGYTVFSDNGRGGGVAGDWVRQETEDELVDYRFPDGIRMTNNFHDRTRFKGRIGNKVGTLKLMDQNGRLMKIIINITGRIRVEKG